MRDMGLDAVMFSASSQITSRGSLRYLFGYYMPVFEEYLVIFQNGDSTFFVHDGSSKDAIMLIDKAIDVCIIPQKEYICDPAATIAFFLRTQGAKSVGVIADYGLSSHFWLSLQKNSHNIVLADFSDAFNRIRMVKSSAEIELMKEAIKFNEDIFYEYMKHISVGTREIDAVNAASCYAITRGAEDMYWMVSSGSVPSLAHTASARRRNHVWQNGDYNYIVIEHSYTEGYFSEITQLFSLGRPKEEYVRAYNVLTEAQDTASAMIKCGLEVNRLAKSVHSIMVKYGFSEQGSPAPCIGHSQGIDVSEFPVLDADDETIITPGMRFNIHPCIVLADGAKITSCESFLSTKGAAVRLSSLPREIIIV